MKNNVDSAFAAMKKLLTLFLVLMRSTSLFADNYDCKIDGIYYKLDEANKTATVTANRTDSGSIVIPNTITYHKQTYSVTEIGARAFDDCSGLASVTIPNSVTAIGHSAFSSCSGLTSVTIPNSVTEIGSFAFSGCSGLTSVTIPNSVTEIGYSAFGDCNGLTSINVDAANTHYCSIDGVLFNHTKDTLIQHPIGNTRTKYAIPNSVTTIGEAAFRNCNSLTSVTIPNSVTKIGNYAFAGCSNLTSVTIPNSVTSIGNMTFSGCDGLTSINVDAANTHYCSIDGVLFNHTKDTLIQYLIGNTRTEYAIPNSVTQIGMCAFVGCFRLKSVTIPNSVTTIGGGAFAGCSNLTSVTIPNSVTTIGLRTFEGCTSLTSITIGNSVTTIGLCTFEGCKNLTSITIPNSVTTIEMSAFEGCKSLTSITIPNSVTEIGIMAFAECSNLTSVTFNAKNCHFKRVTTYDGFQINIGNQVETFVLGDNVEVIPDFLCAGMSKLTSITIPNSVTSIGSYAFSGCDGLTSVTIPNSVTSIGSYAFSGCSGLISVTIPNSVTTIGDAAFAGCDGLTSVTIPNSVTSIGSYAFSGCSGLTSVTILNPEVEIDGWAFERCTITDLYCGTSVDLSQVKGTIKNVHRLNNEELVLSLPFDQYARGFVEPRINEWQKKGEFEKTSDWQARVTETYRKQQIDSLVRVAKKKYLTSYQKNNSLTFSLGTYDADNEVYLVKSSRGEDLLVAIPITDAQYVQQNWSSHTATPHYAFAGTDIVAESVDFTFPNNKTYTYHSSQNLTYAQADIQYNFDPIDLNSGFNTGSSQPKGQQTIQQTQLVIGKSDVDANIPKTNNVNDKTFVVILANEKYESVASVPFANNDGRVFREYCHKTLGIPEQNIHLRENATLNNMRSELGWLKQVCEAYKGEASVIFYYAGHGIPDENDKSAYLLPVDGDGRYVQSGYKLDDLYKNLGSMLAKSVTVFMDACFSGSQRGSGMLASARGIALKAKAGAPQGNMVVFSAAQSDETAYPNNEQGHGMFTYYLLKKLQETKGDVTLKDLGDYITTNVSQQSIVLNSKSQTPCVTPAGAVADSWQSWKLR